MRNNSWALQAVVIPGPKLAVSVRSPRYGTAVEPSVAEEESLDERWETYMHCTLEIALTDEGIDYVNSLQQKITLVKSDSNGATKALAWLAIGPMQSLTIEWDEDYYIFAGKTTWEAGAKITGLSKTKDFVEVNKLYTFEGGKFRTDEGGTPTDFSGKNATADTYAMGLAQVATINSGDAIVSPICAAPVGDGQSVSFTPYVKVSVMLSAATFNGVVQTVVHGPICTVEFSTAKLTNSLKMSDKGVFSTVSGDNRKLRQFEAKMAAYQKSSGDLVHFG